MTQIDLIVEEAGCESCAERVRSALAPFATVEHVAIDEQADYAAVTLVPEGELAEDAVADALAAASAGAGHRYRIRPGSWNAAD